MENVEQHAGWQRAVRHERQREGMTRRRHDRHGRHGHHGRCAARARTADAERRAAIVLAGFVRADPAGLRGHERAEAARVREQQGQKRDENGPTHSSNGIPRIRRSGAWRQPRLSRALHPQNPRAVQESRNRCRESCGNTWSGALRVLPPPARARASSQRPRVRHPGFERQPAARDCPDLSVVRADARLTGAASGRA